MWRVPVPRWPISDEAARLHQNCLVWDQTLPWVDFGRADLKLAALPRYVASGVDFVSLTVATDLNGIPDTIQQLAKERAYLRANADRYILCETADDILAARAAGKL